MNELEKKYVAAPRLQSPAEIDEIVLANARKHSVAVVPRRPRWMQWTPALAMVCVGVLTLTIVHRQESLPVTSPDFSMDTLKQKDPATEIIRRNAAESAQLIGHDDLRISSAEPDLNQKSAETQAMSQPQAMTVTEELLSPIADTELSESSLAFEESTADVAPVTRTRTQSSSKSARATSTVSIPEAFTSNQVLSGSDATQWIKAQPAGAYAIEIARSSLLTDLIDHSSGMNLPADMPLIIAVLKSSESLLITGSFATRSAAVKAKTALGLHSSATILNLSDLQALKQK